MDLFVYIFVYLLFLNCFFTLDVYLDPKESSKLLGPLQDDFYIIQNDQPKLFVQNIQRLINSFRPIPECVDKLTLKWIHDGPQMIRYDIRRMLSLDKQMLTVTTNVERRGFVPRQVSDLTFYFECDTANYETSFSKYFYIEIYILSDLNEAIYDSPIRVWLKKRCGSCDPSYLKYIPDVSALGLTRSPDNCGGCQNSGRCATLPGGYSKCKCKRGYTGVRCELPECKPSCENGGKCIAPQKCQCPTLFTGPMCEQPECNPPCKNGGYCNDTNQCSCPTGFSGTACGLAPTVRITSPPANTTVYSMQAVKFQCRATGRPKPKFKWLDNRMRPIQPDSNKRYRQFKIVVVKSQGYSDLWIYGADASDQGDYYCIAENQYSMDKATATLTVLPNTGDETNIEDIITGGSGSGYWEDT